MFDANEIPFPVGEAIGIHGAREHNLKNLSVAIPRDTRNADEDQAINKESSVILAIPNDGEYWLGKKRISLDDLKAEVEKSLSSKEKKDRVVYIKSGVGVSYGEVVRVINAVREKGIDQIGLVADKKKGSAPAKPAGT